MPTNKKISQQTPVTTLYLTEQFLTAYAGTNHSITWSALKALIVAELTATLPATITHNATTNINLGATTYKVLQINYIFVRGTRLREGRLTILCDATNVNIIESYQTLPNTEAESGGITITSDISTGQIRLNIVSDNSDITDGTFYYKIWQTF